MAASGLGPCYEYERIEYAGRRARSSSVHQPQAGGC